MGWLGSSLSRMLSMPANETDQRGVRAWIQSVRPMPLWLIVLSIVVYMVLPYLAIFVATPSELLPSLRAATGDVIASNFLDYFPLFIIMGLLLVVVGRLRCNDLGLIRQRFLSGVAWMICTWVVVQLLVVLIQQGTVSIDPSWDGLVVKKISLLVTGQLLGNALYEEVFWRAFLISQLVLLMTRVMKLSMGTALAWAIIISSVLFALSHIPNDLLHGREILGGQISRCIAGIIFGSLFLLSNNLFLVIGIHGLVNQPLFLFQDSGSAKELMWFVPLLVLAILAIRRRLASR